MTQTTSRPPIETSSWARILGALVLDVAFVIVFAVSGRASHIQDVLAGLGNTAWPFLLALTVGWAVTRAWQSPVAPLRTGLGVWAFTVAGGMLLRWASDQGVQATFVVVAAAVLLTFLVGWRAVAVGIAARRNRSWHP